LAPATIGAALGRARGLTAQGGGYCGRRLSRIVLATMPAVTRSGLGGAFGGGLELALWCDLRVAAHDAELGLVNLPKGLPCLDGGSTRLPRLIGQGRALDLLLTGRRVPAPEALQMGLVSRLAAPGTALQAALDLAQQIAAFPQDGLLAARDTALGQWSLSQEQAPRAEAYRGLRAGIAEPLRSR
jgi:enoyl-CoA hydratase